VLTSRLLEPFWQITRQAATASWLQKIITTTAAATGDRYRAATT
jgi:hypothetical protein